MPVPRPASRLPPSFLAWAALLLAGCISPAAWAGPLVGELLPPGRVLAAEPSAPMDLLPSAGATAAEAPRRGPHAWWGVLGGGLGVPVLVGTGAALTVATTVKDPAERFLVSALVGVAAGWVAGPLAVAFLSDVRGILPRVVLGALAGAVLCIPAVFIPVVGWAVFAAGPALGALWAVETAPARVPDGLSQR